ncbi:NLR family CARD domain-containing protein 4-like [Lingula anatina]|uniref:NLR family CARD domain-containing protein 4-like n=1 Tax=Lingula anatina TaxID=7574 RepID=A0A2R2MJR5_LINAN|nr:NLR family CARD domain-containing protein 4-like [Lingula anatina]|eukprot:XP_023930450.1 NLR family CARD domain-containing protein 4-like [Lingula anatina]
MSCVPRIPWDDTDTMNIDDVFVDLSLIQEQKKGGDLKKVPLRSYQDIFKPHIRKKRIIIRGKAGCGKSTVAAKMAVDWARSKVQSGASGSSGENSGTKDNSYLEDVSLLFLIRLRFLDKDQTLLESIKDQLIDPSLEISDEALFKYIHSNAERIIIILDGYDEYNHANPQNNISKLIKGEVLASVTVIVTSRPWKAHELSKHRPSDMHVEINDMSADEIVKFIQNHFTGRDPGYHESVVQYVKKFHLSISPTPLLLLFICILWDEETAEQMPNSLTVLYQELVTLISDRYVARQENPETAKCYLSEKTNIIGKIAFDGLLFGNLVFDETNSSIKDLGEQIFHTGIMSRLKLSSIRTKAHKSSFSFIHKTIQEYFAAKHLVESCKDRSHSEPIETFLGHINSLERFQDMANVIQFVCGLSSEVAAVIFSHLHSVTDKDADFKTAYFVEKWNIDSDCNPLFIRLITEMLTNNHVVTHQHMQWLNHLFDFHIRGIYPQAADKILQYAHQITHFAMTSTLDARIHKLHHHTIFPSLKKLLLSDTQYYKDGCLENKCAHPNSRILSGSSMRSLIYLEVHRSNLELFLSLEPPFPCLETLLVRFCPPPLQHLVDMFQLVSTKSMVNLLTLDLSDTVLAECETCMKFNKESQSVRITCLEYGTDPFTVQI